MQTETIGFIANKSNATLSKRTTCHLVETDTAQDAFWGGDEHFNFRIQLAAIFQSAAATDWHARIVNLYTPFSFPFVIHVPLATRFLSADEQKVFHRALRKSVKLVAKGDPEKG